MARINLLPWRAERRKQRQKEFGILLGMSALGAVLLSFLIVGYYKAQISGQNERGGLNSRALFFRQLGQIPIAAGDRVEPTLT